jgi:hypothetical protein
LHKKEGCSSELKIETLPLEILEFADLKGAEERR